MRESYPIGVNSSIQDERKEDGKNKSKEKKRKRKTSVTLPLHFFPLLTLLHILGSKNRKIRAKYQQFLLLFFCLFPLYMTPFQSSGKPKSAEEKRKQSHVLFTSLPFVDPCAFLQISCMIYPSLFIVSSLVSRVPFPPLLPRQKTQFQVVLSPPSLSLLPP